ncbi:MAG: hypothetical protein M3081_01695 [Gemmatimonadota bacterium]|nr:hypothetical protein [Gemmatimonadota bacterium]
MNNEQELRSFIVGLALMAGCSHPDAAPLQRSTADSILFQDSLPRGHTATLYVGQLYRDTALVERAERTTRSMHSALTDYWSNSVDLVARLAPLELISHIEVRVTAAKDGEVRRYATDLPQGVLPMISGSAALLEQLLRRAHELGTAQSAIPVLLVDEPAEQNRAVVLVEWLSRDTARLECVRLRMTRDSRFVIDATGRLVSGVEVAGRMSLLSWPVAPEGIP